MVEVVLEVVGNQLSGSAIRYQASGIRYQVPRRRNRLPHPESIPHSIGPYAWHPSGRRLSEWLLANPSRPVYLFLIHATSSCPDPGAPARECRKAFAASSPRPVRHLPSPGVLVFATRASELRPRSILRGASLHAGPMRWCATRCKSAHGSRSLAPLSTSSRLSWFSSTACSSRPP